MALILGNSSIDFEKLTLGIPNQLQKDVYFSRIFMDDNPIYIQTNECFTSTGIKETNKKGFCDLVYTDYETVASFFGSLEKKIRERVLENKEDWFEDNFTADDLDDSFTTTLGYHKQGIRLRTYIHKNTITERYNLNCYNYNHELITNEKLSIGTNLIPIIEIVGIRFTDKSFNVDLKLVQTLITNLDCCEDTPKSMFSGLINNESLTKQTVTYESLNKLQKKNDGVTKEDIVEDIGIQNVVEETRMAEHTSESTQFKEDNKEDVVGLVFEQSKVSEEKNVKEDVVGLVFEQSKVSEEKNVKEEVAGLVFEQSKVSEEKNVKEVQEPTEEAINRESIEEIDIYGKIVDGETPIKLKTHADIYKEIWKMYKDEAFKVRQQNIKFMLNSKNVHTNFLINEI